MPITIPTLAEAIELVRQSFRANLKGSDAWLWPNNVNVSAKVIGGAVKPAYDFIDYVARQRFVSTADGEWLDKHGADYGLPRKAESYAEGSVTLDGVDGTSVPAGLEIRRADGLRYTLIGGGTVASSTVTVLVRANEPGKDGNALENVAVTLTAPFTGLTGSGVVATSGIGQGTDPETDQSYRARLLQRLQYPPRGGSATDYIAWALAVPGVTRVFVDPVTALNGRTSVGVWFLMDDTYTNGIPQPADVAAVAAHIETLRPAGAVVDVVAPVADTVNITITGLSPNTVQVRDAVALELATMFRREALVSTLTSPFTLYRSLLIEAIANATGEHHHTLTAPASDTAVATGHIPVLGTVTFV